MRLIADNISKRFGSTPVLRDLSFTLEPGTLTLMQGANGSGKSTLLKILALLSAPSSGQVRFSDEYRDLSSIRRRLGFLGHEPMLYPDLSGLENLSYFASLYDVEQRDQRIEELTVALKLENFIHKSVRTYSRGQAQRIALARALVHRPALLLLDEPSTGLDSESSLACTDLIQQQVDAGTTVLLITHDLNFLAEHAHAKLALRRGTVVNA
ncbi:MAG: heme ABC exporter ATP-binding protein CcmA [Myxococcales bacterium]|nr:MAG: heme ABC exporter ATP-binding protein CcmA [Myxococcales bacterium]